MNVIRHSGRRRITGSEIDAPMYDAVNAFGNAVHALTVSSYKTLFSIYSPSQNLGENFDQVRLPESVNGLERCLFPLVSHVNLAVPTLDRLMFSPILRRTVTRTTSTSDKKFAVTLAAAC